MSLIRYIDCQNASDDLLSLLKRAIVQDDDGNWYIRITVADNSEIPISILTDIQCGDSTSIEDIIKNLLFVDSDTGELSFAVYNVE